jgi:hypothetical protein
VGWKYKYRGVGCVGYSNRIIKNKVRERNTDLKAAADYASLKNTLWVIPALKFRQLLI